MQLYFHSFHQLYVQPVKHVWQVKHTGPRMPLDVIVP